MDEELFARPLLPVADPGDARTTCRAVLPYVERVGGRPVLVHVIEKAGGAPDKAGVEQREQYAEKVFDAARGTLGDVEADTELAFGTDVAETIFDVADDVDASVVTFTPRSGSRWLKLLTGDVALDLVTDADRPVLVLPAADDDADAEEGE
jgi:nucleotide-binding universal stress UspA family protein